MICTRHDIGDKRLAVVHKVKGKEDIGGERGTGSVIQVLLGRRAYGLVAFIVASLFIVYYYILEPSNFASFSDTLRYFISALSTLLAVVVSFNTLALRNQLKNMPTSIESLNRQLSTVSDLLQPALDRSANHGNPTLYYTDALRTMLDTAQKESESVAGTSHIADSSLRQVCQGFGRHIQKKLAMYERHKDPFFLVSISTTPFVERLKFDTDTRGENAQGFLETTKRLHVLRNICLRIYIRNGLTKLSYDMLTFTIPVITLAAMISAISNYGSYDTSLLRALFAASMSSAILPFVLLFVRTWPILELIRGSSSIPFSQKSG